MPVKKEYKKKAASVSFGDSEPKKRGRPRKNPEEVAEAVQNVLDKMKPEPTDAEKEADRVNRIVTKNKRTRENGRKFEEMILRGCAAYREFHIASISKVPEPRRVIGRTGNRASAMICVNAEKADPDFMGSLAPDGRCIVFDAKHTDENRIGKRALNPHQEEIMDAHMACGAVCFVAVSFGFEAFYMIPYDVWKRMKEIFGRQYIMKIDWQIREYAVPFDIVGTKAGEPEIRVWFIGKPGEMKGNAAEPEEEKPESDFLFA